MTQHASPTAVPSRVTALCMSLSAQVQFACVSLHVVCIGSFISRLLVLWLRKKFLYCDRAPASGRFISRFDSRASFTKDNFVALTHAHVPIHRFSPCYDTKSEQAVSYIAMPLIFESLHGFPSLSLSLPLSLIFSDFNPLLAHWLTPMPLHDIPPANITLYQNCRPACFSLEDTTMPKWSSPRQAEISSVLWRL